ncbi:coiled-coil domain-containing protein 151 isoform X2 [Stegostoma tigrinum]|uniref:coiled-coil domain-containing protein 151 isoform X2 n=1 Tax=Stegostoma tigrinum TaxID=3053191 RepID=UPI00202AFBD8|nr:coiled-coil domain-containing protein 151 isoform X2 [Stegostoma tigrinum]
MFGPSRVPVQEQIWDLQKKIQLLEGDRKAYYESSQCKIKKNKDTIQYVREENKRLHRVLAGALLSNEKLVKESFQDQHEKAALRNKSGKDVIMVMDQKVCDKIKRLNALKHVTEMKKKIQLDLEMRYSKNMQEVKALQEIVENVSEDAQTLRLLENRLEKTQLKYCEAVHVMKVYQRLKAHLQEESVSFQKQLDTLEAKILQQQQELKELQAMNNDAQLSRDTAKTELQQHEEAMHKERREREKILTEYKKMADEKRTQAERAERRAMRAGAHSDDLHFERPATQETGAEERAINIFEDILWIKTVTGVSDVQDVVKRFVMQEETLKHLQELELENEKQMVRLREEKEVLHAEYDQLKYSGETKLSSEQKLFMELQTHLNNEQKRRDKLMEYLEYVSHITMSVKAGVEHIYEKLKHVQISKGSIPAMVLSPASDEYVLDLLSFTEEKLIKLCRNLEGIDMKTTLQLIEDDEFHASVQGNLPAYNMRVRLPIAQKPDTYDDDDDIDDDDNDDDDNSSDDSGDIVTRSVLKQQSQQIVDWKTKKRTRPKRKKGKHKSVQD